jgi:hypothetical protein
MASTITRGELNRRLKVRVQSAHKKGLLKKIFETGPSFFGKEQEAYELRRTDGVEIKEHEPWNQGSDYTYWDYEVTFPIESKGVQARISIRSHDRSRYGIDEWVTVTIFEGDKTKVVLHAVRSGASVEEDKQNPLVAGGWRYDTYFPGQWERWLNLAYIRKYFERRKKKLLLERQRGEKSAKLNKLKEPPSVEELETAHNFGLIK